MTVMSYIALPNNKGANLLLKDLNLISGCEAEKAENKEVIVLVLSVANKLEEEKMLKEINALSSLASLALVYAGTEEEVIEKNL